MMFIVETGNRNPHIKKVIGGKAQKSKTKFRMQRQLMLHYILHDEFIGFQI